MIAFVLFWLSLGMIVYAYALYPLILMVIGRRAIVETTTTPHAFLPSVSIVIPAYNEASVIGVKIENTLALSYPESKRQIILVSDGSDDGTNEIATEYADNDRVIVIVMSERSGKARALNSGITAASGEIVVFSDASIMLEKDALEAVVGPFRDDEIGCVSGEDRIAGGGGESLYGRYELWLRNLESKVDSIVGASGCFYAQRATLVEPFPEGMAPDFFSVLTTVEKGFRAVTCPAAVGYMTATRSAGEEFGRKVRTILRGMAMLWKFRHAMLMGDRWRFSFSLTSHKLIRWLVPFFMVVAFVSNLWLAWHDGWFWQALFGAQLAGYTLAGAARAELLGIQRFAPVRLLLFFLISNLAILKAWGLFVAGHKVEIWQPTRRGVQR